MQKRGFWVIVAVVYVGLVAGVQFSRRYMRSVADFLAAGRTAGRYLLSVSQGMAAVGAITIVANLEMNFRAGFAMSWWGLSMGLVVMIMAVTGWVVYRFRATRCLTMAEFFERRYSRRFRIFAGLLAFTAGLINFGIGSLAQNSSTEVEVYLPRILERFFDDGCSRTLWKVSVKEVEVLPGNLVILLGPKRCQHPRELR